MEKNRISAVSAKDLFYSASVKVGSRLGVPMKRAIQLFGNDIIEKVIFESKIRSIGMTLDEYKKTGSPCFRDYWTGEYLTFQGINLALEIRKREERASKGNQRKWT